MARSATEGLSLYGAPRVKTYLGGTGHFLFFLPRSFFVRLKKPSFFVPTHLICQAPRAGEVKAGRDCGHPEGALALTAPSTSPHSRCVGGQRALLEPVWFI